MPLKFFFLVLVSVLIQLSVNSNTALAESVQHDISDTYNYTRETVKQVNELAVPLEAAFGSIAPTSVSPYFGLTLLSGAAILSEKKLIKNNEFLEKNKILNNYLLFSILAILTIVTSIPNFTKVSASVNKVITPIEDYSVLVITAVLIFMTFTGLDNSTFQVSSTGDIRTGASAGNKALLFAYSVLLTLAAAFNFYVIRAVRYFFEIIIFLSPFPLVDAVFETGKKLVCLGLFVIYLYSPVAALVINLLIFLITLFFFGKARKTLQYFNYVFTSPLLAKVIGEKAKLIAPGLPSGIKNNHRNIIFAVPVYNFMKMNSIGKGKGWLLMDNDQVFIYKRNLWKYTFQKLEVNKLKSGKDFSYASIFYEEGDKNKIIINNFYAGNYKEITRTAGFRDLGAIGAKRISENLKKTGSGFFGNVKALITGSRVLSNDAKDLT